MSRYIDADSIYRRVKERTNPYGKPTLDYESGVKVLNMIANEPTADVVEVRHGEWVKLSAHSDICCSLCKRPPKIVFGVAPLYCPNCGAKMDGERREEYGKRTNN